MRSVRLGELGGALRFALDLNAEDAERGQKTRKKTVNVSPSAPSAPSSVFPLR